MATAPLIALVGGFLGSGKTTLLLHAAERLRQSGVRAAIITNDQAGALVDTRLAEAAGHRTEEIAGGCFCCRFSDFAASLERLLAYDPAVIFAEPVGSCIDISATVLQPLKRYYRERYRLAPFTVLVDPRRARDLLAPGADPHLAYLFANQMAEADLVCFSKADLNSDYPELPGGFALKVSAASGLGIAAWLAEILAGSRIAGSRVLSVDYQRYADAEAALGWLNWQADVRLADPLSPPALAGPFLDDLHERLTRAAVEIAHLKLFDRAESGYIKASICRSGDEPSVDGDLTASPAALHELVLNLRAPAEPELLREIIGQSAGRLPGNVSVRSFETFRPAPPRPQFRMARIG